MLKLSVWGEEHSEEGEMTNTAAPYLKADTDRRVTSLFQNRQAVK